MYESRCQEHIDENIILTEKVEKYEKGLAELKVLTNQLRGKVEELREDIFDTLVYLSTLKDVESIHKAIADIVEDN